MKTKKARNSIKDGVLLNASSALNMSNKQNKEKGIIE